MQSFVKFYFLFIRSSYVIGMTWGKFRLMTQWTRVIFRSIPVRFLLLTNDPSKHKLISSNCIFIKIWLCGFWPNWLLRIYGGLSFLLNLFFLLLITFKMLSFYTRGVLNNLSLSLFLPFDFLHIIVNFPDLFRFHSQFCFYLLCDLFSLPCHF